MGGSAAGEPVVDAAVGGRLVAPRENVLDAAAAQLLEQVPAGRPLDLVRDMDTALGVLRNRAKPLDNPLPRRRGRSSWQRALRVFAGVEHYARRLARLSDAAADPGWAPTLEPALDRIRANIDGLVALLLSRDGPAVSSAEDVVDAAEAAALGAAEVGQGVREPNEDIVLVSRKLARPDGR